MARRKPFETPQPTEPTPAPLAASPSATLDALAYLRLPEKKKRQRSWEREHTPQSDRGVPADLRDAVRAAAEHLNVTVDDLARLLHSLRDKPAAPRPITPYATQKLGEWALQNEWRYKARKNTPLGGRYGTDFHLSFSHIRPLCNPEKEIINTKGSTGYKPLFFETGDEVLYQDLTVDVTKKINPAITLTAMYVNQIYNQQQIEKEATNGAIVYSHIFITDTNSLEIS